MAKEYLIRRKILTIFGAKFHIFNTAGDVVGFCNQKAFKLKEDIRLYTDESMSTELLVIQARQMLDISAAYDVVDPREGEKVGALCRKGLKSVVRDSWEFLDAGDNLIGRIREDSLMMAMIRRLLTNLIPQKYTITAEDGREVGTYSQNFNPFLYKLDVQIPSDEPAIDPRLIMAGGVLLAAVEGKQS